MNEKSKSNSQNPKDLNLVTRASALSLTSAPMSSQELVAFVAKLRSGWKAVQRKNPAPSTTSTAGTSSQGTDKSETSVVDALTNWIGTTLDDHINKTARQHADVALQEFLDIPAQKEDLLAFIRYFAEAYERTIRERISIGQSAIASSINSDRTTIGMASAMREQVALRLSRLDRMRSESPQDAELFRLSEFGGCSADELASYFELEPGVVDQRIRDLWFDICEST